MLPSRPAAGQVKYFLDAHPARVGQGGVRHIRILRHPAANRFLTALARRDPEQAAMFEKRYLLGCTAEETAELHATSKATVDRKLRLARAWLFQQLKHPTPNGAG